MPIAININNSSATCEDICDAIVDCDKCEDRLCEDICEDVESYCLNICSDYIEG